MHGTFAWSRMLLFIDLVFDITIILFIMILNLFSTNYLRCDYYIIPLSRYYIDSFSHHSIISYHSVFRYSLALFQTDTWGGAVSQLLTQRPVGAGDRARNFKNFR